MCTTILVITTLAFLLRRRFFNKVEPYVLPSFLCCRKSGVEGCQIACGVRAHVRTCVRASMRVCRSSPAPYFGS
uniref:Uncharacterized protein n=1 Tax=Varanus komodoensis TaxID=61221 RepID=A0A8D2Q7G5_VARKO